MTVFVQATIAKFVVNDTSGKVGTIVTTVPLSSFRRGRIDNIRY